MAAASQNLFNVTKKTAIDMKCARFAENTVSVYPPHSVKIIESKKNEEYKCVQTAVHCTCAISHGKNLFISPFRLLIMIFSTLDSFLYLDQ